MKLALSFFIKDSLGGVERRLARIYNILCSEDQTVQCDLVIRGCDQETAVKLFKQSDCVLSGFHRIVAFKSPFQCLLYLLFSMRYSLIQFGDACGFNIATQIACKLSGKKNLYTVCDFSEAYNVYPEVHMKKVKKQLQLADYIDLLYPLGVPFVSQFIKKGKLSITPGTYTDLNVFKPKTKEKTIVFAAARLEDAKNPMLLVDAVNICQKELREQGFHVILLGKGVLEDQLRRTISKYGIEDILEMPGYRKTSDYTPQASVFLSLQKLENYPSQSLAEAAASGCYVIITDVGDSRKCADESFAEFIESDPNQLATALIRYFRMDQKEKDRVIGNARAFAEKNYAIEASKKYYKSLLTDACRREKK